MPEIVLPASVKAPNDFVFSEPEGRPFRAISVETEVDGDGLKLARTLHSCRIVGYDQVGAYGTHPGDVHPCVAFLKYDGTVSGGELVFDRMYLTNPLHAKAFYKALKQLRGLTKNGTIAFNPNCGGHIHVDATGTGFYDLLRLAILYGYCEEPIYRLAGAGATYGHRSLYKGRDHRIGRPGGYSAAIVKGPFMDAGTTFRILRQQPRHTGLNFKLYMENGCGGCKGRRPIGEGKVNEQYVQEEMRYWRDNEGADPPPQVIERWRMESMQVAGWDLKDCTCRKNKFTVEWRVWNSQGNPRILHAWIALMQAMHAHAWIPSSSENYEKYDEREALDWQALPFNKLTAATVRKAQERVDWMFAELPLTDAEKDSLAYAFMRTPYKTWGKSYFDERMRHPYRPPPYPNVYKGIPNRKIDDVDVDSPLGHQSVPPDRADDHINPLNVGEYEPGEFRMDVPVTTYAQYVSEYNRRRAQQRRAPRINFSAVTTTSWLNDAALMPEARVDDER